MPPPTTTTPLATAITAFMERLTYRCNSCNNDVSPNPVLQCPNCNSPLPSSPNPNPNPNPNPLDQNPSQLSPPPFVDPLTPPTTSDSTTNFTFSTVTPSDDNFLLDSPYLNRLIHLLTHSNDSSPSTTVAATTTTTTPRYHSPTSKSAIEAIPTVTITSEFLNTDLIVLCPVCKDQFAIDDVAKQLPCKHIYHPDCILPWLSQRNSCPVCRFEMPKEAVRDGKMRRRSRSRVLRWGGLMEPVDGEAMLRIGFSNLHHQYMQSEINPETMLPFDGIGQTVDVDVLPDSDQNVSGWPNWTVNGGAGNAGWVDDADVLLP